MASACASEAKIRVGDTGTRYRFRFRDCSPDVFDPSIDCEAPILDISSATLQEIAFTLPDDSDFQTATGVAFVTDGTDGEIEWAAPPGFHAQPGRWTRAARITLPSGVFSTEPICFTVGPTIFN